ncbi:hypothetical protein BDN72DRAFT_829759, partial [Pluteus cervinus]
MIGHQAGQMTDKAPNPREGEYHLGRADGILVGDQDGQGASEEVRKGTKAAEIRVYEQGRSQQIGSRRVVEDRRDIRPNGTATGGGKESFGAGSRVTGLCEVSVERALHARGTRGAGVLNSIGSSAAGGVSGPLASVKAVVERGPRREMTGWEDIWEGVYTQTWGHKVCRCQERDGSAEWDEQARVMVLGVVEKYWLWSLQSVD